MGSSVDDAALVSALRAVKDLEARARAYWHVAEGVAEQQAALTVVRHATAVQVALEKWIAERAIQRVTA